MSWSASLRKAVDKNVGTLDFDINPQDISGPMLDQFNVAKKAIETIIPNISGPKLQITMSGHANGIGWNKKEGYANDFITVTVYQVTE